jgi:hypothetical protein
MPGGKKMSANLPDIVKTMLTAAETTAAGQWQTAKAAIITEVKVFAQRLEQIAGGFASQQLTLQDAKDFFAMATNNLVAMIAMATTLVWAAVQKIVNAALSAAKDAINAFVKFPILV